MARAGQDEGGQGWGQTGLNSNNKMFLLSEGGDGRFWIASIHQCVALAVSKKAAQW